MQGSYIELKLQLPFLPLDIRRTLAIFFNVESIFVSVFSISCPMSSSILMKRIKNEKKILKKGKRKQILLTVPVHLVHYRYVVTYSSMYRRIQKSAPVVHPVVSLKMLAAAKHSSLEHHPHHHLDLPVLIWLVIRWI